MSRVLAVLLLAAAGLLLCPVAPADELQEKPLTAEQVQQEIAKIRRATKWSDPQAAKEATARIQKLMDQLVRGPGRAQGNGTNDGGMADQLNQIGKAATAGEDAPIELGAHVSESIDARLAAEDDPRIANQEYLETLDVLCIDFSLPGAQAIVDQLEQFTGIKTLILTGGRAGAPVALDDVLRKAGRLPLETLYITGFRGYVTSLPGRVGSFPGLKRLSVFGNALRELPASVDGLPSLEILYVDENPILTLLPTVTRLGGLTELGVARTSVSAAELAEIRRLLPGCKVLDR